MLVLSKKRLIKDIMTEAPVCVHVNDLLCRVEALFLKHDFHHLPVVNDQSEIMGMISKNDFHQLQHSYTLFGDRKAEVLNTSFFMGTQTKDVMRTDVEVVEPGYRVEYAIRKFKENRFHSLVVVEDERVVGIITPYDILRMLTEGL